MSLMPAFELGLCNAWLFMVPALFAILLTILIKEKRCIGH